MTIDRFNGEYFFLSNSYREKTGLTTEHLFQAAKAKGERTSRYILEAPTPGEAKKRGGALLDIREDWDEIKYDLMYRLLLIKFADPELKRKLLDTGDAYLIGGNDWGDTEWGVYRDVGENKLGNLLMTVRGIYQRQEAAKPIRRKLIRKEPQPAFRRRKGLR